MIKDLKHRLLASSPAFKTYCASDLLESSPNLKTRKIHYCNRGKVLNNTKILLKLIQSTLIISKSKGPSKKLRDIRTSTDQMYSSEEKTI